MSADRKLFDLYDTLSEGDPVNFRGKPATVAYVSESDGQVWVTLDLDPPQRYGKERHMLKPEDLAMPQREAL